MMKPLLLILLLVPICSFAAGQGDRAPEFQLPELGSNVTSGITPNRVTYLDFWASWCAPCRVSFPEIIELQNELGGEQFEVVAVTVDEDINAANRFLRRYDVPYRILSDPDGIVAGQYELPGMPTSFVINHNGVITLRHSGFKPGDMTAIKSHIQALLHQDKEKSP